jgi:hypothetical protein
VVKKKTKTDNELDKQCKAALARVNKHIDKMVAKHLKEMGLAAQDNKK